MVSDVDISEVSDIDILDKMIKETAKVKLGKNKYGKKQVTLVEPQQPSSSVTISGIPDKVIIIKADAFQSPDTVFNGSNGECKRADFIIIADTNKKKVILCIEMKATKDSKKKIIQQLTGTQCFIIYCQEIGKKFWKQQDFLKGYQYRFISIGHTSISKQRTRTTSQSSTHDRPEQMMKIDSPHHLEFNHLAGK